MRLNLVTTTKLAALTAVLLKVDLLILASDIDGLYDADPKSNPDAKLITNVRNIDSYLHLQNGSISSLGTGGIKSKIEAAKLCKPNGYRAVDRKWLAQKALQSKP